MTAAELREALRDGGMTPEEFSVLIWRRDKRRASPAYEQKIGRKTEIIAKLISQIGARGTWMLLGERRPPDIDKLLPKHPTGISRPRSPEAKERTRARALARARAVRGEIAAQSE